MASDPRLPAPQRAEDLAQRALARLERATIRELGKLRGDHLQSGPDSGLRDVWDEICVQVQDEESAVWWAYMATLEQVVVRLLNGTPRRALHAIWIDTPNGEAWLEQMESEKSGSGAGLYDEDDVVEVVVQGVLARAEEWSNPRIRRYLDLRE